MISRNFFIALLALLLPVTVANAQERFVEGTHYESLPNPVPTSSGDKIEVVEVFWYGCPHCFKLEPQVESWLKRKPDNVEFVRIPAVLGRKWAAGAQAYYTAVKLDMIEELHQTIFDAIHVHNKPMNTIDDIAAFFVEHGVDQAKFEKALKSFEVQTNLRKSQELIRRYRLTGVPALIVNGRYRTNNFQVVDFLVDKESGSS